MGTSDVVKLVGGSGWDVELVLELKSENTGKLINVASG